MKREWIIAAFFGSLLILAGLDLYLISLFNQVPRVPRLVLGWLNPLLGGFSVLIGPMLIIWSVHIQYTLGQGTPSPRAATRNLITTGPYAFTRNPMTLGAACFYLGIAFWGGSVPVIVLVLVTFAGLLTFIYFHETGELTERFGSDYVEYRHRTPFLLPSFRRKK